MAASVANQRPPSAKESGVTFSTPITSARVGLGDIGGPE